MNFCNSNGIPSNSGTSTSTLRQIINAVSSKNASMPAVAARRATIRAATYATTGTRPYDMVTAIASSYPMSSPYTGATASIAGAGSGVQSVALTAAANTQGTSPCPVYAVYCRLVASNQVSLGSLGLTVSWQTADGLAMNNTILLDPAQPLPGGNVQAEVWFFPAVQILGRFVYTPANLSASINTVAAGSVISAVVQPAKEVTVSTTAANFLASNATLFVTALTRGQREIDDIFTSYAATSRNSSKLIRKLSGN